MAVVYMDGFEDEGSFSRTVFAGGNAPVLTSGPQGRGQAYQWTTHSNALWNPPFFDAASGSGWRIGFRYKPDLNGGDTNNRLFMQWEWGSNRYAQLLLKGTGELTFFGFKDSDSQPVTTLTDEAWVYIEVATDAISTSQIRFVISINGVVELDHTHTRDDQNAVPDCWLYPMANNSGATTGAELDDLIIEDTFSATPRGNVHIDRLLPNAAGALTDWGGAYTDVDDDDPTTSTGTSISSTTASDQTSYEMENLPSSASSVIAVMYEAWCQGTSNLEPLWRSSGGSVGVETTDVIPVPASYALADVILENNPQTATAWTESDINSGQFGVELA